MISYCCNKEEIISLWSDVFKDSREDVEFFIDNLKNGKCLGFFENDKLLSMLYLVKCRVNGIKAEYIYAACTYKAYEGRGYMTKLIEYASKPDNALCLIPANESLINFYSKRGFIKTAEIESLEFDEIKDIEEYLFEGFELEKPIVMVKE